MLLLVVVVFVFATHSLTRGADVIKLKAANYLPVTHPMSQLSGWFCDEVKKRTNGQVEIYILSWGYTPHSGQDVRRRRHGHRRHGFISHSIYPGPLPCDGSIRSTSRVPERLGSDTGEPPISITSTNQASGTMSTFFT